MRTLTTAPGRALLVICLTSAGWAFSFGVGAPLASLWLKHAGCSDTVIGLNTAVYYGGLALTALVAPRLMRRFGTACSAAGMALAGLTVAAFPLLDNVAWWFALRLLNGCAGALALIPMETCVNRDLPPQHRARNFGLYAVALTLGWALGNWAGLGLVADLAGLVFAAGGAAALVAAAFVHLALPTIPERTIAGAAPAPLDFRGNFLSYGSAWSQGILEGGMVALLPLYLLALGLSEQQTGWLISTTMVGVLVFQVPVAWLADRIGRLPVLLACYALTAAGLVGLPLAGTSLLLPVWLFLVGACSGAFYPLGLALLGERLPESQLDRANAWYLSLEGVGNVVGAALMGVARDLGGDTAMFAVGVATLALVVATWLAQRRRPALLAQPASPVRRAA
jgi:MFS family permease